MQSLKLSGCLVIELSEEIEECLQDLIRNHKSYIEKRRISKGKK